jgi:hypothetical protein
MGGVAQAGGMEFQTDECMFCHSPLEMGEDPENLAFMGHVEKSTDCNKQFQNWVSNMQTDYKGD